jgi:hypothetical protein
MSVQEIGNGHGVGLAGRVSNGSHELGAFVAGDN